MNTIRTLKWTKLTLYISGGGLSSVFAFFAIANPKNAQLWMAAGPALIGIAGALGALYPSPAQAVVQDAPVVTPGGQLTGATNLSTTSELLQK